MGNKESEPHIWETHRNKIVIFVPCFLLILILGRFLSIPDLENPVIALILSLLSTSIFFFLIKL